MAADRARAAREGRIPTRNAHYREFLTELAARGDTAALGELRRMAPHEKDDREKITGGRSQPVFPLPTYSVDAQGAVTYRTPAGAIVKDSVQGVAVLMADPSAYDAALRVAVARYGRTLTLRGDARFMAGMSAAARRSGLELSLRDAARPQAEPIRIRTKDQGR